MIDRPETVLEMARRHVREGEERLARQVALVAKLERDKHTEAAALGHQGVGGHPLIARFGTTPSP